MTFLQAIKNALGLIFKNKLVVSSILFAPILYSFFYPSAYMHQVADKLPVAIVDLDNSNESRAIIRRARGNRDIDVVQFPASLAGARDALERREIDGFILIPDGFERDAISGRQGKLALYSNASYLVRNATVMKGLGAIAGETGIELAMTQARKAGIAEEALLHYAQPVNGVMRPLFNEREGYASYVVPPVAELIIQQTLLVGIALIIAERMRRVRKGDRVHPNEFLGMSLVFVLTGTVTGLYFNSLPFWLKDLPYHASPTELIVLTSAFAFSVTGFSMLLSSLLDKGDRAMQVLSAPSLLIFFLSGISFPGVAIPEPLQWFAKIFPTTPGIAAFVHVNQMRATLHEVLPEICHLLLIGLFGFGIAWWRMGRRYFIPAKTAPVAI